jgi:hypothetical protein
MKKQTSNAFTFQTEAYTAAILMLESIKVKLSAQPEPTIAQCLQSLDDQILTLQKHVEDHTQDAQQAIGQALDTIEQAPTISLNADISELIQTFKAQLAQSFKEHLDDPERFKNPYARAFETSMAVTLFQNPTPEMMQSLNRVSQKILEHLRPEGLEYLAELIKDESTRSGYFGFGIKKDFDITAETIRDALTNNHPENFGLICLIHFHAARNVEEEGLFPRFLFSTSKFRSTLGTFSDEYRALKPFRAQTVEEFLGKGTSKIRIIADQNMYKTDYYKNRGRGNQIQIDPSNTQHLGLISHSGIHQQSEQPFLAETEHQFEAWSPDVAYQAPDYQATPVSDALNHEHVYVSGPSGMTALMLGLAFAAGPEITRASDLQDLRAYLLCIMSYVVAGGLHSIHEVLGPADHCLGLLAGKYHTTDQAPNFSLIFEEISTLAENPQLKTLIWKRYLNYISKNYIRDYETPLIPEIQDEDADIAPAEATIPPAALDPVAIKTVEQSKSFFSTHKKARSAVILNILTIAAGAGLGFFMKTSTIHFVASVLGGASAWGAVGIGAATGLAVGLVVTACIALAFLIAGRRTKDTGHTDGNLTGVANNNTLAEPTRANALQQQPGSQSTATHTDRGGDKDSAPTTAAPNTRP